ncbi:MAG: 3-deoxy-7-phosphoheptulonate synthase [bacterium]|nr:3-deoxy-7-phosphoheptulonate synthase [bacterium]
MGSSEDLDGIRSRIDEIDRRILEALARRRSLVEHVVRAKGADRPLRDEGREKELLAELISEGRKQGLDAHFVTRVFHEIIDDSVRSQQRHLLEVANPESSVRRRVGLQGTVGSYSEIAARNFFSKDADETSFMGYPTFAEVVRACEEGLVDHGVLPIENTTAGSINEVYDLLTRTSLSIVGEELLRIEHCLFAVEEVPLHKIRRILSQPQALAQCMKFLSGLDHCRLEYYTDTAMAVERVKQDEDISQAAIASEAAGRLHGLHLLRRDLADQKENFTRFLVVAQKPIAVDERIRCKTSLVVTVPHTEGALLKALDVFHRHGINLAKLESRPKKGQPFQYMFYVDFEGRLSDPKVELALDDLRRATAYLKILGSYPVHDQPKTRPAVDVPVAAVVDSEAIADAALESSEAEAVPKIDVSYRLASRHGRAGDTVLDVNGVRIGGSGFVVIAGPCSVESRDQIMACARLVKECGGEILRGGCFKPRTSPYSFQGLGYEGVDLLVEAGREYGLKVITEVLAPADVGPVAEQVDVLQIGARNMQNFTLLKEVGHVDRPVLLKRGMMSTIDELLNAAEYILALGNHQVMLCERGIRTFETSTRNTLDLGAIPILKQMTHLPIIVDPSHAAGQRDLVSPLAIAAHAVGPHGMMVEIHPEPEKAKSDGPQALRFPDFVELMRRIMSPA